MLNEGFGSMFPITQSELLATPHIDLGYSDILVENVIKAISRIDALTEVYEKTQGIHSCITDE